jgi:hypothetical protein
MFTLFHLRERVGVRDGGSPGERHRPSARHGFDHKESEPAARGSAEDGKVGSRDQAAAQRARGTSRNAATSREGQTFSQTLPKRAGLTKIFP